MSQDTEEARRQAQIDFQNNENRRLAEENERRNYIERQAYNDQILHERRLAEEKRRQNGG